MIINALYYNLDQLTMDEVNQAYQHVKKQLPNNAILVAIPYGMELKQYPLNEKYFNATDIFSSYNKGSIE